MRDVVVGFLLKIAGPTRSLWLEAKRRLRIPHFTKNNVVERKSRILNPLDATVTLVATATVDLPISAVPGRSGRSAWPSRAAWWTVYGQCGQATKGIRWMTWRAEAKKDGVASEMLRGAGKRALIRRCLNEETH